MKNGRIAYALAQRVPELEAAQEPREAPQTPVEEPEGVGPPSPSGPRPAPQEAARPRSWLHRFFFGP
jgi:hypothetical protein